MNLVEQLNQAEATVGVEDNKVFVLDGLGDELDRQQGEWVLLCNNNGIDARSDSDGTWTVTACRGNETETAIYCPRAGNWG